MTETDTIATAAAATPATEEATDLAALAELTAQRSAVYRLLARLYRVEVDEEFLAELKTLTSCMTRYGLSRPAPMPATKATASSPPTCPGPTPTPLPTWPSITCGPSSATASTPIPPPTPSSRCTPAPSAS